MIMLRILIAAGLLCWAATGRAQEPPPSAPTQAPGGAEPTPTPDLAAVPLLDEVPNYAEVLVSQWSAGMPADEVEIGRAGGSFGRLTEIGPVESTTLQESIALALRNNTELRIQRLNPIAAAVGVRSARSVFDAQFFGNLQTVRSTSPFSSIGVFSTGDISEGSDSPDVPEPTQGLPPTSFNSEVSFGAGFRKTVLSGGQLSLEWTNNRLAANANAINLLVPKYETSLGLSLNQPLLRDFGWRYAVLLVDVAQNTEEQAYYQYKAAIADIVLAVERAYWALVLAIQNVEVEEQGLDLAKELLRQNEGRFKVGALSRTAVLEAKAEVARREAVLVASRARRRNARDELRAVVNYRRPGAAELLMIDPADQPTMDPYAIDLAQTLETARTQRPELIAARLDIDSKKLLRKVAENQLLPRLDLVGSFGLNGLGGSPGSEGSSFSEPNPQVFGGYDRSLELLTDGRYYRYVVGASIEVPIANAAAKADYVRAKIDAERAWLALHQLEESVTLEVKRAVSDLESSVIGIGSVRIARELAEENLSNQRARYDVGLATTKDLLDFQDRLTQARAAEVESLTGYNTALAELRRADGTLLRERRILVERRDPEAAPWWARF